MPDGSIGALPLAGGEAVQRDGEVVDPCACHLCSSIGVAGPAIGLYVLGSTTVVMTQRCLPILRSRVKPSFSYVDNAPL